MKRLDYTSVPVVALSHTGRKRRENEDRYGVSSYQLDGDRSTPVLLAVLCDGIGGHRAGEIAAEMAVEHISQLVAQSDAQDPPGTLAYAIQSASNAIRDQASSDPGQAGMGATCACAWLIGQRLYTATVGDSRVYLLRNGRIVRLSTDHTWVQEAIEYGLLQPEQAANHPNAHVIRRYLGSPAAPEVDLRLRLTGDEDDQQAERNQGLLLAPPDRILLTSDGLTDLVPEAEILEAFQRCSPEEAARQLVEKANARGGHDNITLVTFAAPAPARATRRPPRRAQRAGQAIWRWLRAGCLATLLVIVLVAGLALGLAWLDGRRLWDPLTNPGLENTVAPTMLATRTPGQAATPTAAAPLLVPSATRTLAPSPAGGATLTPWPTDTRPAP